jgi:hypothetical protein
MGHLLTLAPARRRKGGAAGRGSKGGTS